MCFNMATVGQFIALGPEWPVILTADNLYILELSN